MMTQPHALVGLVVQADLVALVMMIRPHAPVGLVDQVGLVAPAAWDLQTMTHQTAPQALPARVSTTPSVAAVALPAPTTRAQHHDPATATILLGAAFSHLASMTQA